MLILVLLLIAGMIGWLAWETRRAHQTLTRYDNWQRDLWQRMHEHDDMG